MRTTLAKTDKMTIPTDRFSRWFFTLGLVFFYIVAVGLFLIAWTREVGPDWSTYQQTWTYVAGAIVAAFALAMTEPVVKANRDSRE